MVCRIFHDEKKIIKQCINALLNGKLLYKEEFSTRLGVEEITLEMISKNEAQLYSEGKDIANVLNNCLNEISYGLSFSKDEWNRHFSFSREEIRTFYEEWRRHIYS